MKSYSGRWLGGTMGRSTRLYSNSRWLDPLECPVCGGGHGHHPDVEKVGPAENQARGRFSGVLVVLPVFVHPSRLDCGWGTLERESCGRGCCWLPQLLVSYGVAIPIHSTPADAARSGCFKAARARFPHDYKARREFRHWRKGQWRLYKAAYRVGARLN
jgi:hypothetical protein